MKKKIILILIIFLLITPSTVKSAPPDSNSPTLSNLPTLINSLQVAVSELQTKVSQLETTINDLLTNFSNLLSRLTDDEITIASHETRLDSLENNSPDFEAPASWKPTFSEINHSITLSTNKSTGNVCKWNDIPLTQQIQVVGVAEMADGTKIYGYGNCDVVIFRNIENFPTTGTVIPVSLDLHWLQIKPTHVEFTITVQ